MVRCRDNSLYCGITNNVLNRIKAHNSGTGAKYTRSRIPISLVYSEIQPDMSSARKRESQVRHWTKARKEQLISAGPEKTSEIG
jgi:putative endonuclease